jgi:hypothetical protein
LTKEGLDKRFELERVGSTEVDDGANFSRDVGYNITSGGIMISISSNVW